MSSLDKIDESKAVATAAPVNALPPAPEAPQPKRKRRPGRFVLMLALPILLAAGGSYVWVTGGRYQETENANLRQAKVTISPEATGRVVSANVSENASVKAGDVLFTVDPEPYRIALEQADAALAAARLNVEQLRAGFSQAQVQERIAAEDVDYYMTELGRSSDLAGKGISAKSSLDDAQHNLAKAQQALKAAQQGVESARAALGGDPTIPTDKHPTVLSAIAARDKAAYALDHTTVRAPADGVIAQATTFKVGQYVAPGSALFSLVETDDSWIEANFKETQLTNMKPGQEAEVVLDTYPDMPLKATVVGINAGTGSEFSLLPAQNATGNWVKVTQRIPVRLHIEGDDRAALLRTGMSATVTVDTGKSRGVPQIFAGLFGTANAAE